MQTFAEHLSGLTLVPGSGGQFEVMANGSTIYSKKATGRYPEIAELKQSINQLLG